jgi:O-acetyl-ADP-ribose deacetylase (regulator of RNase III)
VCRELQEADRRGAKLSGVSGEDTPEEDGPGLRVVLTAVEEGLSDAWERFCGDLPFVAVHRGSIFDVTCDAVVSPANSFGFMDGGIDMAYSERWGWGVQGRLQRAIREKHHGELLVGQAEIVETGDAALPYVITAPTMRVPMVLRESVNPYLAARAVFLLWKHAIMPVGPDAGRPISEVIRAVAFPGLGTGIGRVGPNTCARQVRQAIDDVLLDRYKFPAHWAQAENRHIDLFGGNWRSLQHG